MVISRYHYVAAAAAIVIGGLAYVGLSGGGHDQPEQTASRGGPGGGPPGGRGGPGGFGGAPVIAEPVGTRDFSTRVEALGTLEPREQVQLTANASDRVTAVYFEDGQRVRKGDTLILLANAEERALLDSAQATQAEARRQLERNERLVENNAISTSELQRSQRDADSADGQVRSLQARLGDRVLRAPFEGVLGFRMISTGAYVSPGQAIATLIDDSEMRLEFSIPSVYASNLRSGLEITAETDDLPGQTFTGALTSINNAIDPATRSVRVRATLPNDEGVLKAGMFMTVSLMSDVRTSLFVPEIAVVAEGSRTFVYVVQQGEGPSIARKTEVQLGVRERGVVEVVSGISPGDMIVKDGVLKLRPDMPVIIQNAPRQERSTIAGDASRAVGGGGSPSSGLER